MTTTEPASVELRDLAVSIDQHEVLRKISLSILPGELFVLLGGADSGKSALLRSIAGLDPVGSGGIWIDDEEITHLRAARRGVAMMFENYPLWPHMTVENNVAFALRQRGLPRSEIRDRVARELTLIGLNEFARHLPWQLSRGQQQRVALARTLIGAARINLLDEPFSEQDAPVRERLLRAIRKQQHQTGTTTLLTTQDRTEAMRIADRIAVIHDGELQQVGTPMELYDMPRNRHVAEYMGNANLIDGEIEYAGEQALFRAENGIVIPLFDRAVKRARTGTAVFRPRDLRIIRRDEEPFGDQIRFTARVEQIEFLGDAIRYGIDLSGTAVWMDLPRSTGQASLDIGDQLVVGLDPAQIRILET